MRILKIFLLLLICCQVSFGQNNCGDFENYEESQKWIKEIKQLSLEERKIEIFDRICCELKSEKSEIDFWLTIIIDGKIISVANDIPYEQIEFLRLIPADNINIAQSLCESNGVYPQKCNLGFVLINRPEKPVLNEIKEFENIRIKRRKGKIIIKFDSEIERAIKFEVSHLLKRGGSRLLAYEMLKKGRNKFVLKRGNNFQLVIAEIKGKKLVII